MRILKITTYWSPEEADCIHRLLDELKEAIWQNHGDDIIEMHRRIHDEQQGHEAQTDFDDEILF